MKLSFVIIALFFSCSCFAQKENELVRVTRESLPKTEIVNFLENDRVLQIDSLLIPCSKNSVVKLKNENNEYQVEFFLQRNTSIRNTKDTNYKRAWLSLPFQSHEAAKKFITAFQNLSHSY